MGIRSVLAKPFAAYIAKETKEWSLNPVHYQLQVFNHLVATGKTTLFGKDHGLNPSAPTKILRSMCPSGIMKR